MFKFLTILIVFTIIFFSCKNSPTENNKNTEPEPDSTSHNIIWEIDTIGNFQSVLNDAWGSRSENLWVVGFLYLDSILGSNIAHWNGTYWSYENILEGDLRSIIGFSDDNVWTVGSWFGAPTTTGSGSYILNWNGQNWNISKLNFEGLYAIWGKSSDNLFAVGNYGTILQYDGINWTKMNSGTNMHLKDIWGTADNDIYAVGGDNSQGIGILIHYNGSTWRKIYERTYTPNIPSGYTSTVWGIEDKYYLNSGSGQYEGKDTTWTFVNAPTDNTYLETIRGDSKKNLFFVGHFGLIVHWNGKSWYRYDEFFRKPAGDLLFGCWAKEDNVVIVGRSEIGARGIVYRGKMIY